MLPKAFIQHLQNLSGHDALIREITPVYGGYINKAYRLITAQKTFFVKVNSAKHFPDMFATEAAGLQLLTGTSTVSIPAVIAQGSWEDLTFLLMEWIDTVETALPGTMALLGRQLADMHRHSAPEFGLGWDHKSWLKQSNRHHRHWPDFFVQERLQPTLALAMEKGHLSIDDQYNFEKLYPRIPELFPREPPSLLHGDLWKGNCLLSTGGRPYLVDPNVYYGHREMDLAMTQLFGGFDKNFYDAYNDSFPLTPGWEERMDLCNLYPLLILTVFGTDYRERLRNALHSYI